MAVRGIGDNGGPPLEEDPLEDADRSWRLWCWKRAHRRAWKTPPREIALRRLANAGAAGVSYRAYTLEIMERGVYLPARAPAADTVQSANATPQATQPAAEPERALPRIGRMPRAPRLAMGQIATARHRPRQRAG
jgi:hypothetical protein